MFLGQKISIEPHSNRIRSFHASFDHFFVTFLCVHQIPATPTKASNGHIPGKLLSGACYDMLIEDVLKN